jgi:hypothetical protein
MKNMLRMNCSIFTSVWHPALPVRPEEGRSPQFQSQHFQIFKIYQILMVSGTFCLNLMDSAKFLLPNLYGISS